MAAQFSSGLIEGKNNFARWNDEGGGARAMRWLARRETSPILPQSKFSDHLLSPTKPEPKPKPKQALSKGRRGKRVSGDVSIFDTSH